MKVNQVKNIMTQAAQKLEFKRESYNLFKLTARASILYTDSRHPMRQSRN